MPPPLPPHSASPSVTPPHSSSPSPPSLSLSPMHFCRPQHKDSTVHLECNFCHLLNVGLLCSWRGGWWCWGGGRSPKRGNQIIPFVYTCSQMCPHTKHAVKLLFIAFPPGRRCVFCFFVFFLQPVQRGNRGRRQRPPPPPLAFIHHSPF